MIKILRLPLPSVYLLMGEKAILIDTGTPSDGSRILSFLQDRGIGPRCPLAMILHTHGHWDHAGSSAWLKVQTKACIATHRADAELIRCGSNGPLKPTSVLGAVLRPILNRSYPAVQPDLLIEEEMDLQEFGVAARVLFTPGHTAGSISVITNEKEAIVGDLIFGGWFGGWLFPTLPGLHYFADDVNLLKSSVQKVLRTAPRIIYPGHGGPFHSQDVARAFG